jgi:hypothetical protein
MELFLLEDHGLDLVTELAEKSHKLALMSLALGAIFESIESGAKRKSPGLCRGFSSNRDERIRSGSSRQA